MSILLKSATTPETKSNRGAKTNHNFGWDEQGFRAGSLLTAGLAYGAYRNAKKTRKAIADQARAEREAAANSVVTSSAYTLDLAACKPSNAAWVQLFQQITHAQKIIYYSFVVLVISLLVSLFFPLALIVSLGCIGTSLYIFFAKHFDLTNDDKPDNSYQFMQKLWAQLENCRRVWQIVRHDDAAPDNCETEHIAERSSVLFPTKLPAYLRYPIAPKGIHISDATLYLLYDGILILMDASKAGVGFIPYNDLKIDASTITHVEQNGKIADATEIKRRGGNPVYKYGKVVLDSRTNNRFHVELVTSNLAPVIFLADTAKTPHKWLARLLTLTYRAGYNTSNDKTKSLV